MSSLRWLVLVMSGLASVPGFSQEQNPFVGGMPAAQLPKGPMGVMVGPSGAMPNGAPAGQPPAAVVTATESVPQELIGGVQPANRIELVFFSSRLAVLRLPSGVTGSGAGAVNPVAGQAGLAGVANQVSAVEVSVRPGSSFPYGGRKFWVRFLPDDAAVELRLGPKEADQLVAVLGVTAPQQILPTVSTSAAQTTQQAQTTGQGVASIRNINSSSGAALMSTGAGAGGMTGAGNGSFTGVGR